MSSKNNPESETKAKNKWEKVMEAEEEQEEGRGDGSQEMEPHREGLEFPSREKLEGQLTRMERKVDEYKTQYLRAQAEMDNLRKRIEREKADIIKFGSKQLITDLLPVADSLIHGLESPASEDPQVKSMRDGMSLTLDLLHNTLAKHGVQVINPNPGDPFDPAFMKPCLSKQYLMQNQIRLFKYFKKVINSMVGFCVRRESLWRDKNLGRK